MEHRPLPDVNKAVIYLDQNAFSILFKERAGMAPPKGHEVFAKRLLELSQKALKLQQVVFPHSDLHHNETTVYSDAESLRSAYKFLGGDIPFVDTDEVELSQTLTAAKAYLENREPVFDFDVDSILQREKDVWLPDMFIDVNMSFEQFADGIRKGRSSTHKAMIALVEKWRNDGSDFADVLKYERSFLQFDCSGGATRKARPEEVQSWSNE